MRNLLSICIVIFSLISSFTLLIIPIKEVEKTGDKPNTPVSMENEILNFDENGEEIEISNTANSNDGYYYNKITTEMKKVYNQLYTGIYYHKTSINISPIQEETFKKVFYCLVFDNPELIHLSDQYTYDLKEGYVTTFYPTYTMSRKEFQEKIAEINSEVLKIQASTENYTDYEKELYIHNYILTRCNYSLETENQGNMYGAIIEGFANCRGYSAAFTYLLNVCDVPSGQIIGTVTKSGVTEGHSWNFVILDDEYYYTDVCWDDISTSTEYSDLPYHFGFFNMTYEMISKTHNFNNQKAYLYEINGTNNGTYSYLKSNGLYAYTYEQACDIIESKLPVLITINNKKLMIQCDSQEVYNQLCKNISSIMKNVIQNNNLNIKHCRYTKIDSGNLIIIHDFSN